MKTNVDYMRYVGLQWAKLGRILLCSGSCIVIRDKLSESDFLKWGRSNQAAAILVLLGMCIS